MASRVLPSARSTSTTKTTNANATTTKKSKPAKVDAFDAASERGPIVDGVALGSAGASTGGAGAVDVRASVVDIAGADRALLAQYRFDAALHRVLAAQVKRGELTPAQSLFTGTLGAPDASFVERLPPAGSRDEAALRRRGERAIRNGEVAVVVLAGGMATRFQGAPGIKLAPGEQVVKGTVDVVGGQSFIALKLADARRAAKQSAGAIPFCVMGSFATLKGRNGLEQHLASNGLLGDDVKLFAQSISLRTNLDGTIFGAGADELPPEAYTTPGHGDFFRAIKDSGVLDDLLAHGVKTVMFSNVDNLGATVDARIIGKFLAEKERGVAMMAETVERATADGAKTGAVVKANGKHRILEGFRIPDDVDVKLDDVSINTFYFDAAALQRDIPLDVHAVEKNVDGRKVIQFETVTCEATGSVDENGAPALPLGVLRVQREGDVGRFHDGRFYPVKTPADLDRVRALLRESPVYGVADAPKDPRALERDRRLAKLDNALDVRFPDVVAKHVGEPSARKIVSAPGRINLIGEHVDYQGGLALPAAVHLGVLMASEQTGSDEVKLDSLDLEEAVRFSTKNPDLAGDTTWGRYAKAIVLAFRERGVDVPGITGVLESTLPPGSGMSSSSALCLAIAKAFAVHAGASLSKRELVLLAQRAEHIVGVHCGNMDQSAIVYGEKDHAVLLDCRSLDAKSVAVDVPGYALVVGNTKKARGLVDSEYNQRRAECEQAVVELRKLLGRDEKSLATLRDVSQADLASVSAELPASLRKRAEHVVGEIARVTKFANELANGGDDVAQRLGALLDESHRSLRDSFEVSCDELNTLVDLSKAYVDENGASVVAGSRMMGGGFGGCTLSLVRKDRVANYVRDVSKRYQAKTGLEPEMYVVELGDGVGEIKRTKSASTSTGAKPSRAVTAAKLAKAARTEHIAIANPISAEECPDPSVLRVGRDCYIANTTPQPQTWRPGAGAYPLRKAANGDFNNLVDVGFVFPPGEAPSWIATDTWAPEFHFDKELGYTVSFTARNHEGKLCIGIAFAEKPEGPYREMVPGPFLENPDIGVIDSHIFYDEATGKRSFFWKEDWNDRPGAKKTTPILMQELVATKHGPKLVGARSQTIENELPFEGELVEGASMIKRGDRYYMFYSAGPYYNGDYVTSVARASSLEGPWEKFGANVMPNDDAWEGRGHGYVAQDEHGNDYFVCHGYPKGDYRKRVMLMFPMQWEDGWPRFDTTSPTVR